MNPDETIDAVIEMFARPGFSIVLSFDVNADVRIGVKAQGFAQPGDEIVGTVDAHGPYPLKVMQTLLTMTPIGFVPKGLIRDAYRELTRRECNRRALAEAMAQREKLGNPPLPLHPDDFTNCFCPQCMAKRKTADE